jgi:hypothetical protein
MSPHELMIVVSTRMVVRDPHRPTVVESQAITGAWLTAWVEVNVGLAKTVSDLHCNMEGCEPGAMGTKAGRAIRGNLCYQEEPGMSG